MANRKVSIIIPAYNEEAFINTLLKNIIRIPTETIGFDKEIIVVDDGSTDNTSSCKSAFPEVKCIRQKNQGKGAAVQRGIQESTGDFILVQDADLEYDPADYMPMLAAIGNRDNVSVYGSRILKQIEEKGWFRLTPGRHPSQGIGPWGLNILLSILLFILYGRWLTDLLTGYKIYPSSVIKRFHVRTHGFETDHELTAKLIRAGITIIDVPASYTPRTTEQGKKIRAIDGLIAIGTLIKYRFVD